MNSPNPTKTALKDRVPLKNRLGFGSGAVSEAIMGNSIGQMANYVLNIGLGMRPELVGWLLALPRIWDAFTDPVVGSWSDNFRSRFGRRKPFIFAGALLSGLIFAAMWFLPAGWSEMQYFWYFLGTSLAYYTAFTLWVVPWTAMGCELTDDTNERTRVMAYRTFFMSIGGFVPAWLFALTELPIFDNGVEGARYVGIIVGIIMFGFGLIPIFLVSERDDVHVSAQPKIKLLTGIKATIKVWPFLLLNLIVLTVCAGLFMINGLDPYIIIYYVLEGDTSSASVWIGWSAIAYQVSGLLFVIPVNWLAQKRGKRFSLCFFLCISLLAALLKWICFSPGNPWLALIPAFFMSSGLCALWTISNAMIADACDVGELNTGRRMEGSFNAIGGWIRKLGLSAALLISGYVITMTGFDVALGSAQTESTLYLMRVYAVAIPTTMIAIALVLLKFYPLTENRMIEIRDELEQRRTQTHNT